MKRLSIGVLGVAAALAASATAVSAAPDAPAATTPPVAAAAPRYSTTDTTIGALLEDPAAKAIIDKHLPGLSDNPSIAMASAMTLRVIQPMVADKVTEKMLDDVDADLAKLPAK